ncbi:MAG: hypothetical protein ACP5J4_02455 [Anaerolineae bacterium]
MSDRKQNWPVIALSAAGVFLILLGLMALALPETYEGFYVWQLSSEHAFYLMDVVGVLFLALGVILNWLGGAFWKSQMRL